MKAKMMVTLVMLSLAASLQFKSPHVSAQDKTQVQVQKPTLAKEETFKDIGADDMPPKATGLPLPDLTVKNLCLARDSNGREEYLGVLVANIGTKDAPDFELGINYIYDDGTGKTAIEKLSGLKVGEERWLQYAHVCCGLAPMEIMVRSSSKFKVVADPKYYQRVLGSSSWGSIVKPRILESNEKNNEMTVDKAGMERCGAVPVKSTTPVTPKVDKVKPVRP